ncbi:MAG TPA: DNA repair protein RecO [Candidatus Marinimicrobia bacterium]|nr:DNA repair protein RecO [Candidatus Neomarinimicrobiota bacterium]
MAMELVHDTAYLLRQKESGETSQIVHLFTKKSGRVIVIAKGARQPKSHFSGYFQPFSELAVQYYYKEGRPYHFLSKIEFQTLRLPLLQAHKSALYGMILLEMADKTAEASPDEGLYELMSDSFTRLNEIGAVPEAIHCHFILRFLENHGLGLNLDACAACGEALYDAAVSERDAHLLCPRCYGGHAARIFLSAAELNILRDPFGGKNAIFQREVINLNHHLWQILGLHFDRLQRLNTIETMGKILE